MTKKLMFMFFQYVFQYLSCNWALDKFIHIKPSEYSIIQFTLILQQRKMEKKYDAIICLEQNCNQIPIFSHDYKQQKHIPHIDKTTDKIQAQELIKTRLFDICHPEIFSCYTKLYQFDKVKQEMSQEISTLTYQLQDKHIDQYIPLYQSVFKPLRTLQQKEDYISEDARKVKQFLGIDENMSGELEIVIQNDLNFQVVKKQRQFNQKIEEAFQSLQYKLKVLKYQKDQLVDKLLRMNTKIGDVTIKEEALDELQKGRKRRRQKQSNYEIEKIITTLQAHQDRIIINPADQKDEEAKAGGSKDDIKDQGDGLIDPRNMPVDDIKRVLNNIDPTKIVFTGRNRFFIRRTEEEKINIVCQAIQCSNILEVTAKHLVCPNSIQAWKKKYLNKCLDILESNNVFFIRRPGWCRENDKDKSKANNQQQTISSQN